MHVLINVDVCVTDSDVSASWHFHNGSEQQITDDDERNGVTISREHVSKTLSIR
jgi:hypothetical protein